MMDIRKRNDKPKLGSYRLNCVAKIEKQAQLRNVALEV